MWATSTSGRPELLLGCRYVIWGYYWLDVWRTYKLNVTMPNDGMDFPASTIGDVLDTKGDVLCYEYE